MTIEQALNYCSPIHSQQDLVSVDQVKHRFNIDLKHRQTLPTFFTGNILSEQPKIVTLSLNPLYTAKRTEYEQKLNYPFNGNIQQIPYERWLRDCIDGFANYPPPIHRVFYYLSKCFRRSDNPNAGLANYLHENMINLDWCPYYSKGFLTLDLSRQNHPTFQTWTNRIFFFVGNLNVRFLFIHGATFRSLLREQANMNLIHSFNRGIEFYRGNLLSNDINHIQVLFLDRFITWANDNIIAEFIYNYIQEEHL